MIRFAFIALALSLAIGASAAIPRSAAVLQQFKKQTGYPHGRPGYVIDHIWPLCAGGADAVSNLQWQAVEVAKVKDVAEKRLCADIRRQVAAFLKAYPVVTTP